MADDEVTRSDNKVTRTDLDDNAREFIRKAVEGNWGDQVEINGSPKAADAKAFEIILLGSNQHAMDSVDIAVGVAYLRGHPRITTEDAYTALEIKAQGVDQVLPEGDWGCKRNASGW